MRISRPWSWHCRRFHQRGIVIIVLLFCLTFYHIYFSIEWLEQPEKFSTTQQNASSSRSSFRSIAKTFGVAFLRRFFFPLLRHPLKCLPRSTKTSNSTIALASIYQLQNSSWSVYKRNMYQMSERNKLHFALRNSHYITNLYNGTQWAEENLKRLSQLGVEGTWFKPLYLSELLHNLTTLQTTTTTADWILYTDSDILIINRDFDLRCLLSHAKADDYSNVALLISTDAEGVNTGSFLIRVNEHGRKIASVWSDGYSQSNVVKVDDQTWLNRIFDGDGYLKNDYYFDTDKNTLNSTNTLNNVHYQEQRARRIIVRPCALNSGGGIERRRGAWLPYFEGIFIPGDFAVHFFGRPDKLEQMELAERGSLGFFS